MERRDGNAVTWIRRRGGEGCEVRAIHTTNSIRDPPRRERRKLPRMKMDREGKVVMVVLKQEGVEATLCTMQGVLATDQSARRDGCWTGHEREHGEMGKRCRQGERQMDRGVRETAGY